MNNLFLILSNTGSSTEPASGSGSTEKITEALKNMVKSPIFYIVIGAIVLLIIAIYLLRRIVKPSAGVVKVVVRHGNIYKIIDEKSQNYFMVPFTDSLGAIVSLGDRELSSDKLFINNGPDALYMINYTLTYKIVGIEKFFKYRDTFQNDIAVKLNDGLREYSDNGHVNELIKDYRSHSNDLVSVINGFVEEFGVEASQFKINFIEPLGKK